MSYKLIYIKATSFCFGFYSLYEISLLFWLKDIVGLNPSTVQFIMTLTTIPFVIKPIYGILFDYITVFGTQKKTFLLISNAVQFFLFIIVVYIKNILILVIVTFLICSMMLQKVVMVEGFLTIDFDSEKDNPIK